MWDLPTEEEMERLEESTPKKIPDLAEGQFLGTITEVDTFTKDGEQKTDTIVLGIKVCESDNDEHIGMVLLYYLNIYTKRGRVNSNSYRFLSNLLPQIKTGGEWQPSDLANITFSAEVVYNGNFWNFSNVKFVSKEEGLGL